VQAWYVPAPTAERTPDAPVGETLVADLQALARRTGLAALGFAGPEEFLDTREQLIDRKALGLHGGMQFTYRNPERSTDPRRILPGARSLVVGAWGYRRADPETDGHLEGRSRATPSGEPPSEPHPLGRVARYSWQDYYASLRAALGQLAERLEADGWRARVVCDDNALVDRAAAHRAGIGWFGKNSLLLLDGLGSWFVLGTVVTDAPLPLPAGAPTEHARGCGSCSRCMSACPTGAIVAPGVVDARRCLAWLVQAPGSFPEEWRGALGDRIYGCDECQQVCPINRLADRRTPPGAPDDQAEPTIDLLALLASSDDEILKRHGRWYIAERDPRYLRRNALVALGNTGNGEDPAVEAALRRALADPDDMIREHAWWAAEQLGRSDLAGAA
jgi:epoxyqueuosine reductase